MRSLTLSLLLATQAVIAGSAGIDQTVIDAAVVNLETGRTGNDKKTPTDGTRAWQPEEWQRTYPACDPDNPKDLWANQLVSCVDGAPQSADTEPCETCETPQN